MLSTSSRVEPIRIHIDPMNDQVNNPTNIDMLACLLANYCHQTPLFSKNHTYKINLNDKRTQPATVRRYAITLENDIRVRLTDDGSYFFEVIDGKVEDNGPITKYNVSMTFNDIDLVAGRYNTIQNCYTVYESSMLDLSHPEILPLEVNKFVANILMIYSKNRALPARLNGSNRIINPETAEVYYLYLTNHVIIRPREHNTSEIRYEVITNELGKGAHGSVHALNTLIISPEKLLVTKRQDRVLKLQARGKHTSSLLEHTVASSQPHRGSKHPFMFTASQKTVSARIEHKFQGSDLQKIITKLGDPRQFTFDYTEYRLQLSRQLVYKLIELHAAGFVHRDIKPENIIAAESLPAKAEFIDFGLSKHKKDSDLNSHPGTPLFMPPEVFDGMGTTTASDIYCLGITLSMLWGAEEHPIITNAQDIYIFNVAAGLGIVNEFSHNYQFYNLFSCANNLTDEEKSVIKRTLNYMVTHQPEYRISLADVLYVFETILLEREIKSFPEDRKEIYRHTQIVSIDTLKQYHTLNATHDSIKLAIRDTSTNIQYCYKQLLGCATSEEIDLGFLLERLNIKVIAQCKSGDEISRVIDALFETYNRLTTECKKLYRKIETLETLTHGSMLPKDDKELLSKIKHSLILNYIRQDTLSLTLDNLDYFNRKLEKTIRIVDQAVLAIKSRYPGVSLFTMPHTSFAEGSAGQTRARTSSNSIADTQESTLDKRSPKS